MLSVYVLLPLHGSDILYLHCISPTQGLQQGLGLGLLDDHDNR